MLRSFAATFQTLALLVAMGAGLLAAAALPSLAIGQGSEAGKKDNTPTKDTAPAASSNPSSSVKTGNSKPSDKEPSKDGASKKESSKDSSDRKPDNNSNASNKSSQKPRAVAITPEREAAVMKFVQLNHPELGDLLLHLKSSQTKEYEQAIRELFRASERLAQTKERDVALYELELAVWSAQSKIQLISARLKMSDSPPLREELRTLLDQQLSARLALLTFQRNQAAQRMEKLSQQIESLEASRDDMVDRQMEFLTRGSKSEAKPAIKPSGKPNERLSTGGKTPQPSEKPAAPPK